jgi:teichuronic acid biosynthesis glycosyltransferase TuaC
VRILTFSTLYPSVVRPTHGIFVETRLRKLVETGAVSCRVMAPCPWFPFASPKFGDRSVFARMPRMETRYGLRIDHPRYALLPKMGMSWAPLALFAGALPLLRQQLRNGQDFDLIDSHYFYPDGVAAVLLGRALRKPVVVTARGDDLDLISTYAIPRRWIQWAAKHAAGLITVSTGLKRRLEILGTPPHRVRVLRNGVDLVAFQPHERDRARHALGFTRPTLLAVGNLVPKKRHVVIIEALAQLPGMDLAIVGEGPERSRINACARRYGVADRIHLLGRKPQEELPAVYSAADLLVHPSLREGWPNVLLESMACGTAVVVAPFEGVRDIVAAPHAGRILREATPDCLATTIRDIFAAAPARVDTRRYAEDFDWQNTTAGQIELFESICPRDISSTRLQDDTEAMSERVRP